MPPSRFPAIIKPYTGFQPTLSRTKEADGMGLLSNSGFEIMFFLIFFLILGAFFVMLFQGIRQWNKNNHSPRLTVNASVVAKRTNVSHHHHHNANMAVSHSTSTSYYVTFEVESGDRMELHVSGSEYGMLAEGDYGRLTFQGTRYLDFVRS